MVVDSSDMPPVSLRSTVALLSTLSMLQSVAEAAAQSKLEYRDQMALLLRRVLKIPKTKYQTPGNIQSSNSKASAWI
jgi:hypothetical protein